MIKKSNLSLDVSFILDIEHKWYFIVLTPKRKH